MEQPKLEHMYLRKQKSAQEIATLFKCSTGRINYWLAKYRIPKRSIAEAVYVKWNPNGDPFLIKKPKTSDEFFLWGLGLGLYWGEGNKRNQMAIRLGNTDPDLVRIFLKFLEDLYGVHKMKFKFGLQIFNDMDPQKALRFWVKKLGVSPKQFGKVIVTPARGVGNYREKTKHGVLSVCVSNRKLRDLIVGEIERIRKFS